MKFTTTKTGMPMYDDMIRDLEYFEENKNKTYTIEMMNPYDYVWHCTKGFGYSDWDILADSRARNLVELSKIQREVKEWNMPMIDYSNNGFSQEGITRALLARQNGLKLIPVMVIRNKNINQKAYY